MPSHLHRVVIPPEVFVERRAQNQAAEMEASVANDRWEPFKKLASYAISNAAMVASSTLQAASNVLHSEPCEVISIKTAKSYRANHSPSGSEHSIS